MGALSITRDVAPSTEIEAADLNTPWDEIEDALNGPTSANPGTGLDGSNFAANFPVVVATTVGGLGPTRAGKIGKLRLGTVPFDYIGLVFDATLGKWVSPAVPAINQQGAETFTASTFSAFAGDELPRLFVPRLKLLYQAGLRPQVWTGARLSNSGANTTRVRVTVREFGPGDSALSAAVFLGAEVVHTAAAATYKVQPWTTMTLDAAFPNGPTKDDGSLVAEGNRTAGTGTVESMGVWLRWVSA
jgi:hypothetical protein